MPSRFYLPASGTAGASPTISADWEHSSAIRRPMSITKGSTALTSTAYTPDAADHLVNGDALHVQFVSEPLAAQTISAQTVSLSVKGLMAHANNAQFLTWKLFVWTNAGAVGSTILAIRRDLTAYTTALINRTDSATTTSVSVGDGDRIVLEIGTGGTPTTAGGVQGHNATLRWGENGATDAPANDTATSTTENPWLEFANTLTFAAVASARSVAGAQPAATAIPVSFRAAYQRGVAGAQPTATGTLTSNRVYTRALSGTQPWSIPVPYDDPTVLYDDATVAYDSGRSPGNLTYGVNIVVETFRDIVGAQPAATGTLTQRLSALRFLTGAPPAGSGTLSRVVATARLLTGVQTLTGTLTRRLVAVRAAAGIQPFATGILTRVANFRRTLTGVQPAMAAVLTVGRASARSLTGAQPTALGTLTRRSAVSRLLTSAQPTALGTLTRRLAALRSLTGAPLAATGTLLRQIAVSRLLTGAQPTVPATLTVGRASLRSLTGAQPAATGSLVAYVPVVLTRTVQGVQPVLLPLAYDDPTASYNDVDTSYDGGRSPGRLTAFFNADAAVEPRGLQPSGSGALTTTGVYTRSSTGAQPASTGTLSWMLTWHSYESAVDGVTLDTYVFVVTDGDLYVQRISQDDQHVAPAPTRTRVAYRHRQTDSRRVTHRVR